MTEEKLPQMPTYLQPQSLNEEDGVYEYVAEEGELTISELKILNLHGYVYQSEQNDVDYEYENENGTWYVGSQDIYYFTRIKL
jgi:hypothetical protein